MSDIAACSGTANRDGRAKWCEMRHECRRYAIGLRNYKNERQPWIEAPFTNEGCDMQLAYETPASASEMGETK